MSSLQLQECVQLIAFNSIVECVKILQVISAYISYSTVAVVLGASGFSISKENTSHWDITRHPTKHHNFFCPKGV